MSRWWYLELAAEFPELEIHTGGWGPEQELALIELGERALGEEALWLFTWFASADKDKTAAAVAGMFRMVLDRVRRDRPEAEQVILALQGDDGEAVAWEEIPPEWVPAAVREVRCGP